MSLLDKFLERFKQELQLTEEYYRTERKKRELNKYLTPKEPYRGEYHKEDGRILVSMAKFHADKINSSETVLEFEENFNGVVLNLQKLMWINEIEHTQMSGNPRKDLEQIIFNMEATINAFIKRVEDSCKRRGAPDDMRKTADEIEASELFNEFITQSNIENIKNLRYEADKLQKERCLWQENIAKPPKNMPPKIDIEKLLREENEWRRKQQGLLPVEYELQQVDGMDGHRFECWCADLLKKNGFSDVEVTQGSGDQGVDIIAVKDGIRYAIQCKCYSSDLGNTPIQEVHTGKAIYHCQVGVVITNRYFTVGAKQAADATGTLLWDRDKLRELLQK